jgi:pyridoxal phosphate enzyme (YggS family)
MAFDKSSFLKILKELESYEATLVAVSKTKPAESIAEALAAGQKNFGENYVKELVDKHQQLPAYVQWHFIGHLQRNKVGSIAPFVSLIQSVDSLRLLNQIQNEGRKNNRVIDCLIQLHIAKEETKFGFSFDEAELFFHSNEINSFDCIRIKGFMGMASLTDDQQQVKKEFHSLKLFFDKIKKYKGTNSDIQILSMGMTGDYKIALDEGSNMIRIGSAIFGERARP